MDAYLRFYNILLAIKKNQDSVLLKQFQEAIVSTSRPLFSLRFVKRVVVTMIGGSVFIIGVALLVLPGPAFIVIPIGLALLATEYAWAKRWLRRAKEYAPQLNSKKNH
jgi:uncharacterized protein (TIGR02611 family)